MKNLQTSPLIGSAVSQVLFDRVMADVVLDKLLQTRIRKDFNTACWTYDKEQHFIFIGDAVLPYDRQKPDLTDAEKVGLYQALMHHELAHATWTSRNFKLMNSMCEAVKADFSLLNLMEDLRIEQKHRDTYGTNLGWSNFVSAPIDDKGSPVALLFKMIEQETPDVEGSSESLLTRVQAFHGRIIAANGTVHLRTILKDWMDEFQPEMDKEKQEKKEQEEQAKNGKKGQGQKGPGKGTPSGPGEPADASEKKGESSGKGGEPQAGTKGLLADRNELQTSCDLANDSAALAEAIANSQDAAEAAIELGGGKEEPKHKDKDATALRQSAKTLQLDPKEVDDIAAMLAKMMTTDARLVSSNDPTTRLNRRAMLNPSLPGYRSKVLPKKTKLNISLIVDCSGSMSGEPEQNAVVLTAALHLLALRGFVEGQVIVSTSHAHEVYSFTDEKSVSQVFARSSGEGLERTMGETQALLRKSSAILVFTDGQLADNPIDKKSWHAKGINTVGLYTGSIEHHEYLSKYFDKSLIRPNIKELVHALQQNFARTGPPKNLGR